MRRRRALVHEALGAPRRASGSSTWAAGRASTWPSCSTRWVPRARWSAWTRAPRASPWPRAAARGRANVAFHEADATSLPVGGREFDAALSRAGARVRARRGAALREIHRRSGRRARRGLGRGLGHGLACGPRTRRAWRGCSRPGTRTSLIPRCRGPSRLAAARGRLRGRADGGPHVRDERAVAGDLRRLPRGLRRAVRGLAAARRPRGREGVGATSSGRWPSAATSTSPASSSASRRAPPLDSKRCIETTRPRSSCAA